MKNNAQINCPECGSSIDVQNILAHQLEEELQKKYQAKFTEDQKKVEAEKKQLEEARQKFQETKSQANELFKERLEKSLKQEKLLIEEKLKSKLQEEQAELMESLQKELNEKSNQVKDLNKAKAEIEALKRQKDELKDLAEAEAQKRLNETLIKEKERIQKLEEEKNELKFKELHKQLEDQRNLTAEMKRKQEQGSMQLQGEAQELAIEEWLSTNFPLDKIEEIKKGARGGDCVQHVNTREKLNCGTIYYESKRTKDFQPKWIEKFKADIIDKEATIGVLVTEVMPSDMDRMGFKDGIWICNYEEFKALSGILRRTIIDLSLLENSQENKGEKMQMLYDFLRGNTFKMHVDAIIEGFTSLKTALDSEKRAMHRIWKEREKQIDKVVFNTSEMYGAIKGIGGSSIQSVKALELPGSDDDDSLIED